MKVLCQYYDNNARMSATLGQLSQESNFRIFCIEGAVSRTKNQIKVSPGNTVVLAMYVSKQFKQTATVLLASNPKYAGLSKTYVEVSGEGHGVAYYQICVLLAEKFGNTENDFTIEFKGKDSTVRVSMNPAGELVCWVLGMQGEAYVADRETLCEILEGCSAIQSFSYTVKDASVEKKVSVKRSQSEIYREISHYLNRTLVLAALKDDGLYEQYISATSGLEVQTDTDGTRRIRRKAIARLSTTSPFCVYVTKASIEEITREYGACLR